jgi:hypothetical protein
MKPRVVSGFLEVGDVQIAAALRDGQIRTADLKART